MTVSINGSTGLVFNDGSSQATAATGFGFKNRIINGDMRIDQRDAGASVTPTGFVYTLDRWYADCTVASKFSVQRNAGSVTPPAGFTNYLGVTSLAATTPGASDFYTVGQVIEGFNTADLAFGSASASTITFSVWVYSSLTGTFGGVLNNSGGSRAYPFTYSISAANTWEQKFVTVAGDTSGTWLTNNGAGIEVKFSLGVGSTYAGTAGAWTGSNKFGATGQVNVVATNGATFYITGVQLEKGSTATSFDYRPYGTELQLCQRYCEKLPTGGYGAVGVRTTDWYGYIGWQTEKRANATVTLSGTVNIVGSVGDINTQTPTGIDQISTKTARLYRTGSSFTSQAGTFYVSDSILVTAEL